MNRFADWGWPVLSVLLAFAWLYTVIQCRRKSATADSAKVPAFPQRADAEDLLKAIYTLDVTGGCVSIRDVAQAVSLPEALVREELKGLRTFGWLKFGSADSLCLTEEGQWHANDLIRAHRLWEAYLVDRQGLALEAVHAEADVREHTTTPEELERMDRELDYPAWDPHGHMIPARSGRLTSSATRSLLEEATPGRVLRVVALDDTSEALLAQLVALGLYPGATVEVLEREVAMLRVRVDANVMPLAAAAARHIAVVPVPALPLPLEELPVGSRAQAVEISGSGSHQRRMLDMGFVPGLEIYVVRKAPLGDPTEYRVKETSIALRREDAHSVLVEEISRG